MLLAVVVTEAIAIALLMILLAMAFNYTIQYVSTTTPLANYPGICASFTTIMWRMYLILLIGVIVYIAICLVIASANHKY